MNFTYYVDEDKEIINLINDSFETSVNVSKIELLNNQRILLLKDNNRVIGVTIITLKLNPIKKKKTFYLDYVCIDKNYRQQGLGEKMLKEVERIAKEENIDYIELDSNKKRVAARNLYAKLNFEIEDKDLFKKSVKG